MSQISLYTAMLNMAIDTTPSAFIATDMLGNITHVYISKQSQHKLQYLLGQNVFRVSRLIFGGDRAEQIIENWQKCVTERNPSEINRFEHITSHGLPEYLEWRFTAQPNIDKVIIYIRSTTESVLIDEEFVCFTEQHESVNRELCIAISNLDFHLMDLEQARKKLAALYRITAIAQKTVNEHEVLEEILDGITRELGFTNAAILLLDENTQELKARAHRGYPDGICIPIGKGITGYAALHRELVYVPDVTRDERYISGAASGVSEVAVPLIVDDRVIGILDVESSQEKILQDYDLDMLRSLASQIAMTIDHATHVSKVEVQAITDGMTGLFNYRHFQTILEREYKRATRYNRMISLIMIDIDHFKTYNDTNGHLQGDETLRKVAALIKSSCRDVDFAVRYGGEEFALLLPETSVEEAQSIAERIRQSIAQYPFANREKQPNHCLTISLGIANYPTDATSVLELVDHADAALYQAKHSTRNCVCLYRRYTNPL